MGNGMSEEERKREREKEEEEEKKALKDYFKGTSEGPNLRVNNRIMKFTSLDSSHNLREHYEKRKKETGGIKADWIKDLAELLGALTAPELAGIGALAIAIFIDTESSSPFSTEDALRSVFAEEKISKVWVQIEECLQRCTINVDNKDELVEDMTRIERKLSSKLTALKRSMLEDGHMSSEALRAWVNGAAFHIQMRIHLVRLGGIQTRESVKKQLTIYKTLLDPLFKKHQEMIEGKCSCRSLTDEIYVVARYLVGEDSEEHIMEPNGSYDNHFEAYYYYRYGRQRREIQQYFSDVGQNLQELIDQRGSFNIN